METTLSFSTGFQQSTLNFPDGTQNQTEIPVSVSPTNGSTTVCLIDPQLAFIVALSSGGVIIILLISTLVLTCKFIALKQQCLSRRPTRSNVDLVSGTGYWGTETIEGGIVGPCETNLLLEEVRTDAEDEEMPEEEEPIVHHCHTTNMGTDNASVTMQTSTSRDSCIDPKELENMPLMV